MTRCVSEPSLPLLYGATTKVVLDFGLNFQMFTFLAFLAYMNQYEQKSIRGSLSCLLVCSVTFATNL
jgi:hypothetical protein